jgi:ribosome-associated protein
MVYDLSMTLQIKDIELDEAEIQVIFTRASGPGGQNVNKVSSAVQLRFDVLASPSLPAEVKPRLARLAGRRMTEDGVLVLEAKRYRSQEQNRQDAVERLVELIGRARHAPPARRKTRPTAASKERRLESKRQRGQVKRQRRFEIPDD